MEDHYEYVGTYVDDLKITSKAPEKIVGTYVDDLEIASKTPGMKRHVALVLDRKGFGTGLGRTGNAELASSTQKDFQRLSCVKVFLL